MRGIGTKQRSYAKSHPITQEHYDRDIGSVSENSDTSTADTNGDLAEESTMGEAERLQTMKLALESKDWGTVIASADAFSKDFPESESGFLAQAYKDRATAEEPFVNNRIAVFLPLSGRYGPVAQAIQNSMQFALGPESEMN